MDGQRLERDRAAFGLGGDAVSRRQDGAGGGAGAVVEEGLDRGAVGGIDRIKVLAFPTGEKAVGSAASPAP